MSPYKRVKPRNVARFTAELSEYPYNVPHMLREIAADPTIRIAKRVAALELCADMTSLEFDWSRWADNLITSEAHPDLRFAAKSLIDQYNNELAEAHSQLNDFGVNHSTFFDFSKYR